MSKLNWSHCIVLVTLGDFAEILYYSNQIILRNLSKRDLQEIIKNAEYERLDDKTKQKLINNKELTIQDNIKNPIVINNKNNRTLLTEK